MRILNKKPRKMIFWLVTTLGLLAVLFLAGAFYQTTATADDQNKYPPPGKLVIVEGNKMHLYCIGEGSPTIILESGLGETFLNWNKVQMETSAINRVCSYDRAGFGWSDPVDDPVLSPQVADTLHTLLSNAGEAGPYILVGHSVGGIHVRNFANQYPNEVAGIVLVDAAHDNQRAENPDGGKNPLTTLCRLIAPVGLVRILNLANSWADTNPHLSADQRQMLIAMMNQNHYCHAIENEETAADTDMSQPLLKSLGDIPLIVLTATQTANRLADELPADIVAQVNTLWTENQLEMVALSSNSRQIMANESAHYIQYDQPELIVEAIQQMVVTSDAMQ